MFWTSYNTHSKRAARWLNRMPAVLTAPAPTINVKNARQLPNAGTVAAALRVIGIARFDFTRTPKLRDDDQRR